MKSIMNTGTGNSNYYTCINSIIIDGIPKQVYKKFSHCRHRKPRPICTGTILSHLRERQWLR